MQGQAFEALRRDIGREGFAVVQDGDRKLMRERADARKASRRQVGTSALLHVVTSGLLSAKIYHLSVLPSFTVAWAILTISRLPGIGLHLDDTRPIAL